MRVKMTKIRYVVIVLAMLSLKFSCSDRDAVINWDEGEQNLTVIRNGVPAYHEVNIVYRRGGKPILKVDLQEPVVISVASKPERWGFFQFPGLYRNAGGQLVAKWNMAEDAASSYGKKDGSGFMLSSDKGKTWSLPDHTVAYHNTVGYGNALLLPGTEERISIHTPPALKLSELQLPQPVATNLEGYGRTFSYYRINELPAVLQGVYLNRWDRNGVCSEIHAGLEDPQAVRYTDDNLFPVVWWGDMKLLSDNSIVAGIYPAFYETETGGVDPSGISFYRTTDKGMNWKLWGKIPYSYDLTVDPNGNRRLALGFTEPAFEILLDGTFYCVMRTTDGYGNSPMYLSRSSDRGVSWSPPEAFTPSGVLPRLLQLDNGVLVLASGRPGVQLRFSIDGKGEKWTDPFEMLPFIDEKDQVSCGYTNLLATDTDSFLLIYSDFKYLNSNEEVRKAIKIREIKITKK